MIYNPFFEARGIDAVVVPMGCGEADYAAFLTTLFRVTNVIGALVAMPHKMATASLVDRASAAVAMAGACNAVRRGDDGAIEGEQFDGDGFVSALTESGGTVSGASALVVGCGGVGAPIAAALARSGLARLTLFDVRGEAADALAQRIASHAPSLAVEIAPADPAGFDIVVNATPLGMRAGDPPPVDPERITPGSMVGDVVMEGDTALMAGARRRGCRVVGGMDMLYAQIPSYLAWFGLAEARAEELRALSAIPQAR